jgi:hypothetical protein
MVTAKGEVLFSDNRCELRANMRDPAVQLVTPLAIVNGNRVRNAGEVSISLPRESIVAAVSNITSGKIVADLKPEMTVLNINA